MVNQVNVKMSHRKFMTQGKQGGEVVMATARQIMDVVVNIRRNSEEIA